MRKTKKRKGNAALWAAAILLCMVLLSTHMTSGLYARYAAVSGGSDGARVAAFVLDVEDETDHTVDVSQVNAPGKSATFRFAVRNHNDSRSSEVTEEYQLFAELHGSLPLTVTVTGEGTNMSLTNSAAQENASAVKLFQAGENGEHTYTVTVTWPEDEKDPQYANAGLSEVVLRISAWQVD